MNCKLIFLTEQKYMGISTTILYKEHDEIDFLKLQSDVVNSEIRNRDASGRFIAIDSDFKPDSFQYTPLVPVTKFEGEKYYRFTRKEGDYYSFEVNINDLGPKWFQECNAYIEENHLKVNRIFDMEYYTEGYENRLISGELSHKDQTISILYRKSEE